MPNKIHPTSIIENSVKLGDNIEIGPFCYISGDVSIADGNIIKSHVVITGNTEIGENNIFHPFANIGDTPQDLKFENENSYTKIGKNNVFRENVTIHSGTSLGNKYFSQKNLTKIGDNSLFMVGSHVAHDCFLGNNIILANNATLAGHVTVYDHVIIGGLSAIQQFVRVGQYSIIGGMSGVESDVVPYSVVMGERANIAGVNIVGLRRKNFTKDSISNIKKSYDILFDNNEESNISDRIETIDQEYASSDQHIKEFIDFLAVESPKPLCKPKSYNNG